jgi:hypothetical protein
MSVWIRTHAIQIIERNCKNDATTNGLRTLLAEEICLLYLDDIIVLSSTFKLHLSDLWAVFHRIREVHLVIYAKKCHFAQDEIAYLR